MDWYIGKEWKFERKGLRKIVLDLEFKALDKPHMVSKVVVCVHEVENLNGRHSNFLGKQELLECEQSLEMGTALTPVDCYLELLVREMIVGERARCFIQTKEQAEEIRFDITLIKIVQSQALHTLSPNEMYALALRYKENGVAMFKEYLPFAHDYFARAAKCLISYKPFDGLTQTEDGVDGADMQALFVQIQTNLAACLLILQRYEDVLYQTQFVETMAEPSEKSVYRRALAYVNMKEFAEAKRTIEKIPNYKEKKEFAKLHQRIKENWKTSNDEYKHVVQRMFS